MTCAELLPAKQVTDILEPSLATTQTSLWYSARMMSEENLNHNMEARRKIARVEPVGTHPRGNLEWGRGIGVNMVSSRETRRALRCATSG